jgi:hypothetical protein
MHNEELLHSYTSPVIIRAIKLRMRWAGHAASMREMRNVYIFWLENLKGRDHLEDLGVDGKIILQFLGK